MVRLNKKAVFFTFIAILLVSIMMIFTLMQHDVSYRDQVPSTILRVSSINKFVNDFEQVYLERAMFAITHKAINGMIIVTNTTPSPVKDFDRDFKEAMLNGTIQKGNITLDILKNATLTYWIDELSNISRDVLKTQMDYNIDDIKIEQNNETGPWQIEVTLFINYNLTSHDDAVRFNRTNTVISMNISIFDFEDPYIRMMTDAEMNHTINKFNYTGYSYDAAHLIKMINESAYIDDGKGIAFIERFGSHASSTNALRECCGIISLIKTDNLPMGWIPKNNMGYVDYQYMEDECQGDDLFYIYNVSNKADYKDFHLDTYYHDKVFAIDPNASVQDHDVTNPCGS